MKEGTQLKIFILPKDRSLADGFALMVELRICVSQGRMDEGAAEKKPGFQKFLNSGCVQEIQRFVCRS